MSVRDIERFGIDVFIRRCESVHVLNVFNIYFPSKKLEFEGYPSMYKNVMYDVVSLTSLLNQLNKISRNANILFIGIGGWLLSLLLIYSKARRWTSVTIQNGAHPDYSMGLQKEESLVSSFLSKIKKLKIGNLVEKILYVVFRLKIDYLFYGGSVSKFSNLYSINNAECKIGLHALDYDNFILNDKIDSVEIDECVVFLDQNIPYHIDRYLNDIGGVDHDVSAVEEYYDKLNSLFDCIEHIYDLPVVIAAHPRSKSTDKFHRRSMIFGDTAALVSRSLFTLTMFSTSVNYSVLYSKPVFFVYFSRIEYFLPKTSTGVIFSMAEELSMPVVNLDCSYESIISEVPQVNTENYRVYKFKYICDSRPHNDIFWDMLLDRLL